MKNTLHENNHFQCVVCFYFECSDRSSFGNENSKYFPSEKRMQMKKKNIAK